MRKIPTAPKKTDKYKKKVSLTETQIIEIDTALTGWAAGKLKSSEVRKVMRKHGVTGDLREATAGSIEVYPIGGGSGTTIGF